MSDEEFPLLSGKIFNIASSTKVLTATSPIVLEVFSGVNAVSVSVYSLVVGLL